MKNKCTEGLSLAIVIQTYRYWHIGNSCKRATAVKEVSEFRKVNLESFMDNEAGITEVLWCFKNSTIKKERNKKSFQVSQCTALWMTICINGKHSHVRSFLMLRKHEHIYSTYMVTVIYDWDFEVYECTVSFARMYTRMAFFFLLSEK